MFYVISRKQIRDAQIAHCIKHQIGYYALFGLIFIAECWSMVHWSYLQGRTH